MLDLPELVDLHMEAFADQRSARLGRSYVRQIHRWFLQRPDAVNLVAVEGDRLIGFVEGAPEGYAASRDRALRGEAARAFLGRPWLLLDRDFRWALGHGLHRFFGRRMTGVPDASRYPGPPYVLLSIAVSRDRRGQGVAGLLMEAFEDRVAEQGYRCVRLSVKTTNVSAMRAYEKSGWERLGTSDPRAAYYMREIGR